MLLEQVDQREVEGARARLLLLLCGEQPCRFLLQVRVQLTDHRRALQTAAAAALVAATAAGVAARPPRVGEDAQAEVLIGDAWLAYQDAADDGRHGRGAALGGAQHDVVMEVPLGTQVRERRLHALL